MLPALYRAERNERAGCRRSAEKRSGAWCPRAISRAAWFCLPGPPRAGRGAASLSARARPERKRRGVNGQARAGGGWGRKIYFSLNNDGSVTPFCSFPNIKSHIKFLA